LKKQYKQSQSYDWLVNLAEGILKALFFLFYEPYKGIRHRCKENPKHLKYILILQLLGAIFARLGLTTVLYNAYLNSFLVKVIPQEAFRFSPLFIAFAVGHIYCLIWRLPWLRKETNCNRAFKQLGMVPACNDGKIKFLSDTKIDNEQRCLCVSNPGLPLEEFQKRRMNLEAMLKFNLTNITFGKDQHCIRITYRTKEFPKIVKYEDFHNDEKEKPYKFGVGLAINGEKIFCTLPEMVHLLVAGETGGGKSTFLRQFVVDLLKSPTPIKMYLVDLKGGVEFLPFKNEPRVTLIKDFQESSNTITKLNHELDKRLKLFEEQEVNDFTLYNEKSKVKLPRVVVVIDECAEIFMTSSSINPSIKEFVRNIRYKIGRLARLSRAVGIHLVLATQRPDKGAIDMQTKDNMVSRLCFRVNNDYASQMVLRDGRAAKLPKVNGRAIWKGGSNELELQVPYLMQDDVQNLLPGA